jgi:hypothetical protein
MSDIHPQFSNAGEALLLRVCFYSDSLAGHVFVLRPRE